ncbi:MAG TPA: AMP-binding protein [Spirochaetota bacterium]|nr:AMP-binding protein [Spirochaetota bacterium]HPV42404.1 AMP-binding protein [Spirochaetota bacterium]
MKQQSLPWHKEYKVTGIPVTLKPYPDKPVYELLYTTAKKYKKNGLIQFNHKITYAELKEKVDRLATAFYNLGLKKGDRVAAILPTSIQFVLTDYAISRAGLVHIPSSSLDSIESLEHKFKEGKPRALVTLSEHADVAAQLLKKCKIEYLILCDLHDFSKQPGASSPALGKAVPPDALWMTDLIDATPPSPPDIAFDVENDIETLMFTGGTTGLAKGCMLTHRNIYANSMQGMYAFGLQAILLKGAITVLMGLPFFHTYGHSVMHNMTLLGFNQILVPDPRDTDGMIRMIKEHCPLMQFGVPTQFMKLSEELDGYAMLGVSGSAALPTNVQDKFESKAGGGIMEGYGLSEMSPTTHLNTSFLVRLFGGRTAMKINTLIMSIPGNLAFLNFLLRLVGTRNVGFIITKAFALMAKLTSKKPDSAKKKGAGAVEKRGTIGIPYPDVEVKFLSVETGNEVSIEDMMKGERGEMLLRGPNRMMGYWPDRGSGIDEDGFIHTSDVVRIDENGFFYIVDRTKDMIIVSGYKVYSREVDDILYHHPKVEMAATVGIPDPEREGSERVAVYIQPREKYRNDITEEEIIDYLKQKVAKYAVPRAVMIIDSMPLTEVHKVNKKLLREMAKKDAASMADAGKVKKEKARA